MTDPAPAKPVRQRKKPTPAAKASRLVAAGAAVGASLAMVGTMAGAAANSQSEPEPAAATIRRVVVPQQAVSEPIVIMLPQQATGQAPVAVASPTVQRAVVPTRPDPAPAPAPAVVPKPVAESGGS